MALFLVQHGKSLPKDVDPEKGLSDEGAEEVERVARAAGKYGIAPSTILHSGKKRARQTAEIMARALNPPKGVQEMEGLAPLDDVTKVKLKTEDHVMLVGHLPFMERLTTYLTAGSDERPAVVRFQNGGIVCLDRDPEARSWFVKWMLVPHIG